MRLLVVLCLAALAAAAPTEPTNLRPVVSRANPRSPATADGPDILIHGGTVVATAADYEMDGTMWVTFTRQEDSTTYVYRSTDHGLSWEYRMATYLGGELAEKLGLVVGEGDSAFVYLFYLDPRNDGDLWSVRAARDGSSIIGFPVAVGPDTIRDFAVCRDYTGDNYWLYAVLAAPDASEPRQLRFLRSSTYGTTWSCVESLRLRVESPHLSAGANAFTYLAFTSGDTVHLMYNWSWFAPGHWVWVPLPVGEEVADAVIAADFTLPESSATVWALWSQNYQNSGDWDVKYCYSTDGGWSWSQPAYLAGTTAADEQFPDLRNYTSLGNTYVNASYVSELGGDRRVYRHYANAANPGAWSDTLRINEGSAGTGSEIRPKLCYTPGGPFSGAGCVFVGAGLNGCWWNAPYPTGTAEPQRPDVDPTRLSVQPSIGRGPFRVCCQEPTADLTVHDRAGRLVRRLALDPTGVATWHGTDARGTSLANGVYFCRMTAGDYRATEKVVLQK